MADNNKNQDPKDQPNDGGTPPKEDNKKKQDNKKYFKTMLHGLRLRVSEDKYIQFKTHVALIHGDKVKIGYLVTSDAKAIKLCKSDYNVEEISEKTYKLETEG